jgi:hypothetical protein
MKKSVKVILHLTFWLLFPLVNAVSKWSNQFDILPGFESLPRRNIFQILNDGIQSLFIPVDVGSPITGISNLVGIIFNVFIYLILPIAVFYCFYVVLIPKFLKNKNLKSKIIPMLLVLVLPFVITTIFNYFTIAVAWKYVYCLTITYIVTLIFAIAGSFFCILENWILTEKLAKQNLQSELALLKNQINPHFLFNTLNNIDSLIKSNSEKASETLVKLSEILRYMIYDTDIDKALLSNEIQHIVSYIDLQKIQYANKELVSLSIQGNPDNISIAAMLFIPFVENAFKHCNNKNTQNAIRITFSIDNNIVNFECINLFDKTQKITKDKASGIGLNIIKRRLEIIYPDKHTLNIKEEIGTFKVTLSVNTYEH